MKVIFLVLFHLFVYIPQLSYAIEVYYCSEVLQLQNNLPKQRSMESFELFKILRQAENKSEIKYDNVDLEFTLFENAFTVHQLNEKTTNLASDYPKQRFLELMPLFVRIKKIIKEIKNFGYKENLVIEAMITYTFLVDAKSRVKLSLKQIEQKISENISFYNFKNRIDVSAKYLFRGQFLFTFAKPNEIDLLDFIRARALGYHIIGITSLDRIPFDGFSKQGSVFFSKHDGYHAKQALKRDQDVIRRDSTLSTIEHLKLNRDFLMNLVDKIEHTKDLRIQVLQKILIFHFDHELGYSLRSEINSLNSNKKNIQLDRELKNIISDIYFENYGPEYKDIIGQIDVTELKNIFTDLFQF